jgi:3-deoxy-7-phosphoheptulonate synthase
LDNILFDRKLRKENEMHDAGIVKTLMVNGNGHAAPKGTLPLVTREPQQKSVVLVGRIPIGGIDAVVMAGPCSVETREQVTTTALSVKRSGAVILRGGAYKPRTSPYDFQGLGVEGLKLLREAGDLAGMPIVTEVMSEDDVAVICEYADMLQVGARNMQNFALLKKLSKTGKPILLKRGPSATVKEWLASAEYILHGGNDQVVLCERGIKTFDHSLRNTLDLASVALVKEMTHLPVVVDPSHATGKRSLISATAKAGLAVGADGVIVEVHPRPEEAWSDGDQSLTLDGFSELMENLTGPMRAVFAAQVQFAMV